MAQMTDNRSKSNQVQPVKVSQLNAIISAYSDKLATAQAAASDSKSTPDQVNAANISAAQFQAIISGAKNAIADIHNELKNGCPKCNQTGIIKDGNECDLCDGHGRSNDSFVQSWSRVKSK